MPDRFKRGPLSASAFYFGSVTSAMAAAAPGLCLAFSRDTPAFRAACGFMLARNKTTRSFVAEFGSDRPRYGTALRYGTTYGGKGLGNKGYDMQTNVSIIQAATSGDLRASKISLIIAGGDLRNAKNCYSPLSVLSYYNKEKKILNLSRVEFDNNKNR